MSIIEQSALAKIILLKGHSMVREVFAKHLSECDDIHLVDHVGTIADAQLAMNYKPVDIIVADSSLPGESVLTWVEELKSSGCGVKVILMSYETNIDEFIHAVRLGVDGYVVKTSSYEHLLECIKVVSVGGHAYAPEVCTAALRKLLTEQVDQNASSEEDTPRLSTRENQVMEQIAKGLSNKEIALELSISVSTVKTHVSRIFKRMGVSSRLDLIPRLYALAKPDDPK